MAGDTQICLVPQVVDLLAAPAEDSPGYRAGGDVVEGDEVAVGAVAGRTLTAGTAIDMDIGFTWSFFFAHFLQGIVGTLIGRLIK